MAWLGLRSKEFMKRLRPALDGRDACRVLRCVQDHLTPEQMVEALSDDDRDTVNVALACLAGAGTMEQVAVITRHLRSCDPLTVSLAEHALWSIWFRGGDERANSDLRCIVRMIHEGRLGEAIAALDEVAGRCPDFAEVYNQRATAAFLLGDYSSAAADCRLALRFNPHHFGAMITLAACLGVSGEMSEALRLYEQVSGLHPTMEGIRESICHLRRCLSDSLETDNFHFHSP